MSTYYKTMFQCNVTQHNVFNLQNDISIYYVTHQNVYKLKNDILM